MKKFLSLAAIAAITLTACTKEDDGGDTNPNEENKTLEGVWTSVSVQITEKQGNVIVMDTTEMGDAATWEFTSNGMIISKVDASKINPLELFSDQDTLFYAQSGSTLYLKDYAAEPNDSALAANMTTFTSTDLTLEASEADTDGGVTFTTDYIIKFKK